MSSETVEQVEKFVVKYGANRGIMREMIADLEILIKTAVKEQNDHLFAVPK